MAPHEDDLKSFALSAWEFMAARGERIGAVSIAYPGGSARYVWPIETGVLAREVTISIGPLIDDWPEET